jgi:hypothetical protein
VKGDDGHDEPKFKISLELLRHKEERRRQPSSPNVLVVVEAGPDLL